MATETPRAQSRKRVHKHKTGKEFIVVAGPNGAGKTTFVNNYLSDQRHLYLSADDIAVRLSPQKPALARLAAGREFSQRLRETLQAGESVLIESTLSERTTGKFLKQARRNGYLIIMVFIHLESPGLCVKRVRERVLRGGHDVHESDIRRRFSRSKGNFWGFYRFQADEWHIFYNVSEEFEIVASGKGSSCLVLKSKIFGQFLKDVEER
ncbi:MAG: AAA family ATPase [Acidobacteriota bacterium]